MLELQLSLLPERPYQGRTSLHGTQAIARAALQVVEVGGAAVGEFVMLQMSPDVFGRVQFRCVGGQLLDLNRAVQGLQVLAYQRRAMRGQSVPDENEDTIEMLPEGVQELDDLRPL